MKKQEQKEPIHTGSERELSRFAMPFFRSSAGKYISIIVPIVLVLTFLIFVGFELTQFNAAHINLQHKAEQTADAHSKVLAEPVWNIGIERVKTILTGIAKDPDFNGGAVFDEEGQILGAVGIYSGITGKGEILAMASHVREHDIQDLFSDFMKAISLAPSYVLRNHTIRRDIVFETDTSRELIGELYINATDLNVLGKIEESIFFDILLIFLVLCAVSIALIVGHRRVIGAPLARLLEAIEIAENTGVRKSVTWKSQDEFGMVADAFNKMQKTQEESEKELLFHQESLESMVDERTKELKESEERFRSVAQSAYDAIISSDHLGSIVTWNKGATALFGYTEEEMLDRPVINLIPERYRSDHRKGIKRMADGGETRVSGKTLELHALHKDGSEFPIEMSLSHWKIGNSTFFSAIIRDITERKHAENQLQNALVDAERANQAKSEFLATMSHEFRTPLNAILGFSEMLRSQYFGPLGADNYNIYANDIHTSGEHMLELVNDMLDIAAIEAGKRPMVFEDVDVSETVKDCVRNVEPAAQDSGINLSLDAADDTPSIYADKRSITQIIFNLLSNAIKFTEQDGTISVFVTVADDTISIMVSDTGVGIPPDRLSTVTDPFTQTHSDPHITQQGTGLGLSIVKSLVDVHNGELNIESEFGKGTIVTVTLPTQEKKIARGLAHKVRSGL